VDRGSRDAAAERLKPDIRSFLRFPLTQHKK
jgi:hypothetical protein